LKDARFGFTENEKNWQGRGDMRDLEPFTRIIWKSSLAKAHWSRIINDLSKLYRETEWQYFIRGHRTCYVAHIYPESLDSFFETLNKLDLAFFPITKSKRYRGFSHKHLRVKPGDPYFYYGVVVKRGAEKTAQSFIEASKISDHKTIGKLLGYPDCCVKFFDNTWAGRRIIDPLFEAALNTKGCRKEENTLELRVHPYCNQFLRYFGLRITPHLPHSFDCKRTIRLGQKWFDIMKELNENRANTLKEILSMPLTWDCFRGVAIIDTKFFRGITNSNFIQQRKIVKNLGWDEL